MRLTAILLTLGMLALSALVILAACWRLGLPPFAEKAPADVPPVEVVSSTASLPPSDAVPEKSAPSASAAASKSSLSPELPPEPKPLPEPTLLEMSYACPAGGAVVLRVKNAPDAARITLEGALSAKTPFFTLGDEAVLLLPVPTATVPGEYALSVLYRDRRLPLTLTVTAVEFPVQYLTMPPETAAATLESAAANAEYESRFLPLRWQADPLPRWDGAFLPPVTGAWESTAFGSMRYTNDDPTPSRHGGVDLAAPTGTPVCAPQNGRVLFADKLDLTGNSLMIEHGLGLKTWYYHMDTLAVSAGELVSTGQALGTVGNTGYSTGPHLHYSASVGSVYIDPALLGDESAEILLAGLPANPQ